MYFSFFNLHFKFIRKLDSDSVIQQKHILHVGLRYHITFDNLIQPRLKVV